MSELELMRMKALARKRMAESGGKQSLPEAPKTSASWSELPGNIPGSIGDAAGGLYQALRHPLDTFNAMDTAATGGMQNLFDSTGLQKLDDAITPDFIKQHSPLKKPNAEQQAKNKVAADAMGGFLRDRYGGLDNIKNTIITDPFGALLDASAIATGGGALAAKIPALGQAGKILSKAGEFTNPINAVAKPIARYTPIGTAAIEGQNRASTALLKGLLPKDAAAKVAAIGPEAMLLDASPSMTGLARGVAAKVGAGTDKMVGELLAREKMKSPRMKSGAEKIFGKGRDPEALKQLIMKAAKKKASPFYNQYKTNPPDLAGNSSLQNVLAQQLTDPAKGMSINARTQNLEWMNKFEDALLADTPQEVVSRFHSLRKELDKHIDPGPMASSAEKANADMARNARAAVDDILKNRVPGFAEGDKIYSDAHKAREAVDFGYNSLDGGKSAIFPETFNKTKAKMPAKFVEEGVKSRIANAMGTQSNDLVALRKLMGGDGDFNRAKLEATFGPRKVENAIGLIDNESLMSQNFADIVRNSKTAQSLEAAKLLDDTPRLKFTGSETMTGLPLRAGAKALNYLIDKTAGKVSAKTSDALANALTAKGADLGKIISALEANKKIPANDKLVIRALLFGRSGEFSTAIQPQFQ